MFVSFSQSCKRFHLALLRETVQDVVHQLSQLICLHGMQTNPDASAGVERLAISSLRPQLGCAPGIRFSARDISGDAESLLEPHGVFYAKGFTRAFCCQTVLLCAYESPDFLKAQPFVSSTMLIIDWC